MPFHVLEHAYRRPYLRRMRAINRRMRKAKAGAGGPARPAKPTPLPSRDLFAADAARRWGGTVEHWKAEYDRGQQRRAEYDAEMERLKRGE